MRTQAIRPRRVHDFVSSIFDCDLHAKHAIKQVDRFFSNTGVDVWKLFADWAPFVVGGRPEIASRSTGPTSTRTTSQHATFREIFGLI